VQIYIKIPGKQKFFIPQKPKIREDETLNNTKEMQQHEISPQEAPISPQLDIVTASLNILATISLNFWRYYAQRTFQTII